MTAEQRNVVILVDVADFPDLSVSFVSDLGATGNVHVPFGPEFQTTINLFVVTQNGPQGGASLRDVSLPAQPDWLSSQPQAAGNGPAWQFVASGGALNASATYGFTVAYLTSTKTINDPTIINVDPTGFGILPEGRRDAAGSPQAVRAVA